MKYCFETTVDYTQEYISFTFTKKAKKLTVPQETRSKYTKLPNSQKKGFKKKKKTGNNFFTYLMLMINNTIVTSVFFIGLSMFQILNFNGPL